MRGLRKCNHIAGNRLDCDLRVPVAMQLLCRLPERYDLRQDAAICDGGVVGEQ